MTAKRKVRKPKKHTPSQYELLNDPSLRWFPYHYAELLETDAHGRARFARYTTEGQIELLTVNGMAPIPGSVGPLTVRRVQFYKEGVR